MNVLNHELTHAFEWYVGHAKEFGISTEQLYKELALADDKKHGKRTFPSEYAMKSYYKHEKEFRAKSEEWEASGKKGAKQVNRKYIEDFAESSYLYLNPITHNWFVREYPNRAKMFEILYKDYKVPTLEEADYYV